ncbi:MAG: hypothetical protein LBC56_00200 [Oscillospiraceae bacterium]|nr:hypothetical protein [Oscillospiraceae bacterium]
MSVAFIDDGISDKFLFGGEKHSVFHFTVDNNCVMPYYYDISYISHGTFCASIFTEFVQSCSIIDIKLKKLNNNSYFKAEDVLVALKWCAGQDINILCMSIGSLSIEYALELKAITEELSKKNTVLICASSNTNKVTFPSFFPFVIGVRYDSFNLINGGGFFYSSDPFDGINITASLPECSCIEEFEKKYRISYSRTNSLISPYIASIIARSIQADSNSCLCLENAVTENSLFMSETKKFKYRKDIIADYQNYINIPVVTIIGGNECREIDIKKLWNCFYTEKYSCLLIKYENESEKTDLCNTKFKGIENIFYSLVITDAMLRDGIAFKDLLIYISNIFVADIIILLLEQNNLDILNIKNIVDLTITNIGESEEIYKIIKSFFNNNI